MLTFSATGRGVLAAGPFHQPRPTAADTVPPTVTISSPTSGQSLFAGATVTVNFLATDNISVVSQNILFTTDGINFTPIIIGLDANVLSIDFMLPTITTDNAVLRVEAV